MIYEKLALWLSISERYDIMSNAAKGPLKQIIITLPVQENLMKIICLERSLDIEFIFQHWIEILTLNFV